MLQGNKKDIEKLLPYVSERVQKALAYVAATDFSKVENGEYEIGVTFCGSGQGISIAANKFQHVRSATCWNPEISALAKQHNDANICAIPGRFVTDEEAIAIVEAFLNAEFEGGRHARRVAQIPIKK